MDIVLKKMKMVIESENRRRLSPIKNIEEADLVSNLRRPNEKMY